MNDNKKITKNESDDRFVVKKGEVEFLTEEEIEKKIKNKYTTYNKEGK